MIAKVAGGFVALILLVFAVSAFISPSWHVERAITIAAPPTDIYPLIASLQGGWPEWNPWHETGIVSVYTGPDGAGARQTWTGGSTNGGTLTITKANPERGIDFTLEFGPFALNGVMTMETVGDSTRIAWSNQGRIVGMPVYRFARLGLRRFVGDPMERGLRALKEKAERHT